MFRISTTGTADKTLAIGGGDALDQAVDFVLQIGPVAAALREAGDAARAAAAADIHEAVTPFCSPQGVRMAGAAWIVTGRRESSLSSPLDLAARSDPTGSGP